MKFQMLQIQERKKVVKKYKGKEDWLFSLVVKFVMDNSVYDLYALSRAIRKELRGRINKLPSQTYGDYMVRLADVLKVIGED